MCFLVNSEILVKKYCKINKLEQFSGHTFSTKYCVGFCCVWNKKIAFSLFCKNIFAQNTTHNVANISPPPIIYH